ncbi:FAD-dependent monooxygenase [Candidimonas humi]|uniref:FAD-dependent monooxygenase n=1 Tax=Candidimonas humi TaxID=683355 RepID=A0ABV8P171_9BURK|nr:FAD-dependent monooxygenase [Candidimonas humi]MBV6305606.1 FAD-dependent monooxygenase [Candidimonas humi]
MKRETIIVCGSGIVGLAAALGLARAGFGVALLGPRRLVPAAARDEYCPRVYAISPASQQFLEQLGVWPMLDDGRVTSVETMEVHGDADGQVTLHAWQAAQPTLAWIVESSELERALQQAVRVYGIAWHDDTLQSIQGGTVSTAAGRTHAADLLVGADGAASPVREAAGIHKAGKPYGDVGLVAHLTAEYPHQHTAMQWFNAYGVLALLPLPDTADGPQVSMVWSMPAALAQSLQDMPQAARDQALEARLQAATGDRLGRLRIRSPLLGFPLFMEHSAMIAPGVALVGDAAHRVHPLAGQGLNLGLGDVRALLQALQDKEPYRGVGDLRVLQRYRRARAEPVLAMRLATDGLHSLFAAPATPWAWARNAGMRLVDGAPLVKRFLIAGASDH